MLLSLLAHVPARSHTLKADVAAPLRCVRGRRSPRGLGIAAGVVLLGVPVLADQVLDLATGSITDYLYGSPTPVQSIRPLPLQRGAGLDGTMRKPAGYGWSLAGNPSGEGWNANRYLGSIDLATGTYSVTDVDMAFPSAGYGGVTIGRTVNGRQQTSAPAYRDSDAVMGFNWHQLAQPEFVLFDADGNPATKKAADVGYIVYGADRFLEFKRTGDNSDEFKGKNGVAGVVQFAAGATNEPDTYTYFDQAGNRTSFFGFDADAGSAAGQFWKIVDPAGNTAYVGDATTGSTAISSGYSGGKITKLYDAASRRYCSTYTTVGGVSRLMQVVAETDAGGGWGSCGSETIIAQVDYGYYTSDESGKGKTGDLKLVTITTPLSDSGVNLVKEKYYRYYDDVYDNSDGRRGKPHQIKMVVGFEGCRNFDYAQDSLLDDDFLTASDADLKPYSEVYLEYESSDNKVSTVYFNGECGCGGGNNGTYTLTHEDNGSFSNTSGYDTAWKSRVLVAQPDSTFFVQYFDENGQPLSRVITNTSPVLGATSQVWATKVERNSSGQVSAIGTPANANTYTHSTGAITSKSSVGKVDPVNRVSSSGNVEHGLPQAATYKEGSSGTASFSSWHDYAARELSVGTNGLVGKPLVDRTRRFHTDSTSSTDTTKYDETDRTYTFHSNTSTDVLYIVPKQITATLPVVTTATNGSNSSNSTDAFLRTDGTVAFSSAADGIYTYTQYSNGQLVKSIQDAQTNHATDFASGDDPYSDFQISENGSGLRRITTYTYDAQGRLSTVVAPQHQGASRSTRMYYTKRGDGCLVTISIPLLDSSGTPTYYGPASYTVTNHAGKPVFQGTIAFSGGSTTTGLSSWIDESDADSINGLDQGTLARMTTTIYNSPGTRPSEARTYHSIPGSGVGAEGTNYDAVRYSYDDMGRAWRVKDQTGTITRTIYDDHGRISARYIGTNDYSFSGGEASGPDNMVKVEELEYDGSATAGNSLLTKRTLFVQDGATDKRETTYAYDFRGRMVLQTNPQAPHVLSKHDNLGRVIATGLYSSAPSSTDDPTSTATNRVGLSQTFYDAMGRVWKTQRHKIDLADGSDDDNLQALTWYDAAGRVTKTDGEQLTKTIHDRLGRVTNRFVLSSDDDSGYTDADDVTGDTVLEERQTTYEDESGNVVMTAMISRLHSDFGFGATTGALDTNSDGGTPNRFKYTAADIKGRIQIMAMWYDSLDRLTTAAQYGTNHATDNAADFDRKPSGAWLTVPSRSATVLVTSHTYNDDGTLKEVTDPGGKVSRTLYDALGRKTATIRNYVNGTPSSVTGDDDVYTRFTYANGHLSEQWVDFDGNGTKDSSDQVTTYTYGVTKGGSAGDSKISSGRLLHTVLYPEQYSSQPTADRSVTYAYNAQGQQIWTKDQAGNIHEYEYDTAGRRTQDRATTIVTADGFDDAVKRIATVYTSRGQVQTVTQFNTATVGSPDTSGIIDQVKYTYDDWGPVALFEQDHDSAVGTGSAYAVAYTYAKATTGRNTIRCTQLKQQYGGTDKQTVAYGYSSTNLDDDNASRVTTVSVGGTVYADYRYLGVGTLVDTYLDQPDIFSRAHDGATPPVYRDMDRFSRPIANRWTKDLAADRDFVHLEAAFDEASNPTRVIDSVQKATAAGDHHFDAAYTVDGLNRVTGAREGHWDGTQITTGNRRREQLWTLNQVGDQALDQLDLNGDGDQGDTVNSITELNDTRTYSDANELKTRDINSSAPAEYSLGYDKAGNRIDDGTYDYVYDAWYRLVKVKTQAGATVCEYRYNGLRYRVSWRYDNSQSGAYGPDGTVDGNDKTFHFAYDTRWRPVATYRESDSDPKEQLVYHNAGFGGKGSSSYIDSVLLRDKDANAQAGSPPADTFAWDEATDGTLEQRYYYCQNWRGDVVAIVKSDGSQVVEWVKYLAYGRPDLHPFGDSDQDGAMLPADGGAYNSMYLSAQTTYFVRADTNLSGTITSADLTANSVDLNSWPNAGIDQLSRTDTTFNVGNRIGYAGMQWDPVIKKYLARVRWLGAGTGTWTQRDALGYIDGLSLYQYVGSSPVGFGDPMGLSPVQPCVEWAPELVEPLPGQPLSYTGEAVDSAEWQYNININNPIPFGSPLGLTGTVSARLALKQTERGSNSTFHFDATTTCSMQGSINTPLGAIPIPGFGITLMSTRTYGDWRIRCFGPHPEQILIGKDLVDTASGIFGNLEQTSDVAWSHFAGGNMEYLKAEATTNSAWTLPPVTINFSVSGKPFGIGAELSVSMEIHGSLRESISLTTWVWTCGCVRLGRPDTADPITQP